MFDLDLSIFERASDGGGSLGVPVNGIVYVLKLVELMVNRGV
jgi:hypothetical protein